MSVRRANGGSGSLWLSNTLNRSMLRAQTVLICLSVIWSLSACGHQARQPDSAQPVPMRPWSLATSGDYRAVVVGDLNGDQHPDVAGGSSVPGTVAIWYGNGRGGWSSPFFFRTKGEVRSIALSDFDSDGRPDLAFSIKGENPGIQVWLNRGKGSWEKGKSPADSGIFHGIRAGDINGDGAADLIGAAADVDGIAGIKVWLGDGHGSWLADVGPTARNEYTDVAAADFNEDGHLDICASGLGPYGALRVWLGDGMGGWSDLSPLEEGNFYAVSIGDLNRDGHVDLFAGTYRNGTRVYLGNGGGGFVGVKPPVNKGSFWKAIASDVNSDGRLEVVASSLDSRGISAWSWQDGKFSPVDGFFGSSGSYYDVSFADVDGDNLQDLIAASYGQGVLIWSYQRNSVSEASVAQSSTSLVPLSSLERDEQAFPIAPLENEVFVNIDGRPQYKIGIGDVLEIGLWKGLEESEYEVPVQLDGKISFTFLEDIPVTGLTTQQVDKLVTERLSRYVKNPKVDVVVKEYNSKFVTVLGAINTTSNIAALGPGAFKGAISGPGTYVLTGRTTVLQALARAGGPTNEANLRQVTVRRKNGKAMAINLNKVITQGDLSQNVVLDDGDAMMVPPVAEDPRNRVFVFGEVKSPGVFPTRGQISVMEAIALAGGFEQRAVLGHAKILRGDMTKPEVIACDINRLLKKGDMSQNIALHGGDVLYVPKNTIGNIADWLREISPILEFIIYPARVHKWYTDDVLISN